MINTYDDLVVLKFKRDKAIYRANQICRSVNKEICEFTTLKPQLFTLKFPTTILTRTSKLETRTNQGQNGLELKYFPEQKTKTTIRSA